MKFAIVQHFDNPDHKLYFLWTGDDQLMGCSRDQWGEIVKHVPHEGCHGHGFNVCFPDFKDKPDEAMMGRIRGSLGIPEPKPTKRVQCPTCGAWTTVSDEPESTEIPIIWHPTVIKRDL